jgi:hypothetical protein
MKVLFFTLIMISFNAFSQTNMRFQYKSYDGQISYECDHKKAHDVAPFYDIFCFDQNDVLKKTFFVVASISQVNRSVEPQSSIEINYRVTEKKPHLFSSGSTHWIHLSEQSPLHSFQLSQSVEDDQAGLYLSIRYR